MSPSISVGQKPRTECSISPSRLDVARETYKENLNDAFDLCDELKKELGLEGMTLLYSNGGFVFSCSSAEWDEHASEVTRAFVNVVSGVQSCCGHWC